MEETTATAPPSPSAASPSPAAPFPAPCLPVVVGRRPLGTSSVGLRVFQGERRVLGRTNLDRAMAVWVNLRGADSDFDDLQVAVAEALGWHSPGGLSLPDLLESTATVVDSAPWQEVRRLAVDVFFASQYLDGHCYECSEREWRTLDELADDVQFDGDGSCRLCALDGGAQAGLHAEVSRAVACGRVSWTEVCDAALSPGG